jgi:hypothetical protein
MRSAKSRRIKEPWKRYMPKRYGMSESSGSFWRICDTTSAALMALPAHSLKEGEVIQSLTLF